MEKTRIVKISYIPDEKKVSDKIRSLKKALRTNNDKYIKAVLDKKLKKKNYLWEMLMMFKELNEGEGAVILDYGVMCQNGKIFQMNKKFFRAVLYKVLKTLNEKELQKFNKNYEALYNTSNNKKTLMFLIDRALGIKNGNKNKNFLLFPLRDDELNEVYYIDIFNAAAKKQIKKFQKILNSIEFDPYDFNLKEYNFDNKKDIKTEEI